MPQLFVSLLTTWRGYSFASLVLLCMALLSFAAEFWWIEVVYKRFPVLHDQFRHRDHEQREAGGAERRNWRGWLEMEIKDWIEFARLPIFCSESLHLASTKRIVLSGRLDRDRDNLPHDIIVRRDVYRVHQSGSRMG
jgi:hypothetical protein